jgi:hypothetical protein
VIVVTLALAVATLAVFAAEARAGSFDTRPPKAALMKYKSVLQVRSFSGGGWSFYQNGGWAADVFDNFGEYYFPKADVVGAGTRLHVRLAPERPSVVEINAWPRVKDGDLGGKTPAGQRQKLKHTFRRVERDGETVAWDVFFRVGEPERHYYLVVHAVWERVPGTHISYGDAGSGVPVRLHCHPASA